MSECWIPCYVELVDFGNNWAEYDAALYRIFKSDFIESSPTFQGKQVGIRVNPRYDMREETCWHITCRDYGHESGLPESRNPDLERCRRIKWPRSFIDNHEMCEPDCGYECNGVKVWQSTHKPRNGRSKKRIKLFLEEEQYLIVLEERRDYFLLITAYYVDEEDSLKRIRKEMQKKCARNAGSAC